VADDDSDGFIGLPPGVLPPSLIDQDSGTIRRERAERPRADRDEIVFFPAGAAPVAPVTSPVEAVEAVAPPVAGPAAPTEVDDETVVSISRNSGTKWRLVVPGRAPVDVDGVLFLGRNPVATPEHPTARVLAVDDPAKSVSKTHAMLELEAGTLWAHDLDSTNGVWVVPAGQDAIEVTPGTRVAVPVGADLELGDLVIQVEHG
jgi:hypothetical protein